MSDIQAGSLIKEPISSPTVGMEYSCVTYQDGVEVHELSKTRNTLENMCPELIKYYELMKSFKAILATSNGL